MPSFVPCGSGQVNPPPLHELKHAAACRSRANFPWGPLVSLKETHVTDKARWLQTKRPGTPRPRTHLLIPAPTHAYTREYFRTQLLPLACAWVRAWVCASCASRRSCLQNFMRAAVPKYTLDGLYASGQRITQDLHTDLQQQVCPFGYTVVQTLITQIAPDASAASAITDVGVARYERFAAVHSAESNKTKTVIAAQVRM